MPVFDLRTARLRRGETVAHLTRATGVSRATIERIERDAAYVPRAPTALALATHFGIDVLDIYDKEAAA